MLGAPHQALVWSHRRTSKSCPNPSHRLNISPSRCRSLRRPRRGSESPRKSGSYAQVPAASHLPANQRTAQRWQHYWVNPLRDSCCQQGRGRVANNKLANALGSPAIAQLPAWSCIGLGVFAWLLHTTAHCARRMAAVRRSAPCIFSLQMERHEPAARAAAAATIQGQGSATAVS